MQFLERPKWIPLDIFIEEIIFFDLIHFFVNIEEEESKKEFITNQEVETRIKPTLREKVWVRFDTIFRQI